MVISEVCEERRAILPLNPQPYVKSLTSNGSVPDDKPLPVSSSEPPKFAPEQEVLFREVLLLMNESGIPYVVSGAFALHEHTGIWRDTKDLDIFLPPGQVPNALGLLKERGFVCDICDPVWLAKVRRGAYFVDLITGMSNAVIRVEQSWIDRAVDSEVLSVPVKVLAAEELIASKVFVTRRERFDGADIAHIVYAAGNTMDWSRLLQLIGNHWEMLFWSLVLFHYIYPMSNAVPKLVWEELLAKFRSDIENPDIQAAFRGSLIDENMFAIDVKEWGMQNVIEEYRSRTMDGAPESGGPELQKKGAA